MFSRLIYPLLQKQKKSLLLLGPRQTGKTTLLKQLAPDVSINLAHESTFLDFQSDPDLLEKMIKPSSKLVLIDEVQRIPALLNTIQTIIDDKKLTARFLLSGSSARKLKRGNANLLPGRIIVRRLGPLSCLEFNDTDWKIENAMRYGTLPGIILEDANQRSDILSSYAGTYLKEEIQAESLTRDLSGFARFLRIAASVVGEFVDFTKISSYSQIKRHQCARFFEILEDTLIVERIESFQTTESKRLVQHPKFYFFDNGVLNGLLGNFDISLDRKGKLFENLVYSQLRTTSIALGQETEISTYRTEHGAEVDFILKNKKTNRVYAIEVKSNSKIIKPQASGFESFESYYKKPHEKILIYSGKIDHQEKDIRILPLEKALRFIFGE